MAHGSSQVSSRSPMGSQVGDLLRHWRSGRRLSQLELALEAEISSRHLSYVETGRSQPSREMVIRLADALGLPLREQNVLLVAAGYAPEYQETGLGAAHMAQVRQAVEFILKQQEPYPAVVMDRCWNVWMQNQGSARLLKFLLGGPPTDANIARLIFRPDMLRPYIGNWEQIAGDLLRNLQRQAAWIPEHEATKKLIAELLAIPGVPEQWKTPDLEGHTPPLLTAVFKKDDVALRFFFTLTTFGTPFDITLDELRIECSYPADEETVKAWRKVNG